MWQPFSEKMHMGFDIDMSEQMKAIGWEIGQACREAIGATKRINGSLLSDSG